LETSRVSNFNEGTGGLSDWGGGEPGKTFREGSRGQVFVTKKKGRIGQERKIGKGLRCRFTGHNKKTPKGVRSSNIRDWPGNRKKEGGVKKEHLQTELALKK